MDCSSPHSVLEALLATRPESLLKWRSSYPYPQVQSTEFWTCSQLESQSIMHCEVAWWKLSRSMTKILTTYRLNSFEWRLDGLKREIHSFPTMYIMGEGVVEMGQNNDFLKKLFFFRDTYLDQPTLGWSGTQHVKCIAIFNMCSRQNFLLALFY